MQYLFIGGHNDGKRVEVPAERQYFVLPYSEPEPVTNRFDRQLGMTDYKTEVYEAIPFEANGKCFIIYAIDGMPAYQVLDALIERYPTPKQPEPMKLKYQSEYDAINNRRMP